MTIGQFPGQHPAFAVVALGSVAALVLAAMTAQRRAGGGGPRHSAAR
jgi:hypothetical protein